MAQPFSLRYPLIEGQGNFGSMDGQPAAAHRYTEARMRKITSELLKDLDKDTVNFVENFDGLDKEPVILPARIPNLLINGVMGIDVGMATSMPPHNLTEVLDGVIATIKDPEINIDELMKYIHGPDFPTGGVIFGTSGIKRAYHTGNGSIILRAKYDVVEKKNKTQINLSNGWNILSKEKFKTGDSILFNTSTKKIEKKLALKEGNTIYITGGKHAGMVAKLKEIKEVGELKKERIVKVAPSKDEIESTDLNHIFVIGEANPAVKVE